MEYKRPEVLMMKEEIVYDDADMLMMGKEIKYDGIEVLMMKKEIEYDGAEVGEGWAWRVLSGSRLKTRGKVEVPLWFAQAKPAIMLRRGAYKDRGTSTPRAGLGYMLVPAGVLIHLPFQHSFALLYPNFGIT